MSKTKPENTSHDTIEINEGEPAVLKREYNDSMENNTNITLNIPTPTEPTDKGDSNEGNNN